MESELPEGEGPELFPGDEPDPEVSLRREPRAERGAPSGRVSRDFPRAFSGFILLPPLLRPAPPSPAQPINLEDPPETLIEVLRMRGSRVSTARFRWAVCERIRRSCGSRLAWADAARTKARAMLVDSDAWALRAMTTLREAEAATGPRGPITPELVEAKAEAVQAASAKVSAVTMLHASEASARSAEKLMARAQEDEARASASKGTAGMRRERDEEYVRAVVDAAVTERRAGFLEGRAAAAGLRARSREVDHARAEEDESFARDAAAKVVGRNGDVVEELKVWAEGEAAQIAGFHAEVTLREKLHRASKKVKEVAVQARAGCERSGKDGAKGARDSWWRERGLPPLCACAVLRCLCYLVAQPPTHARPSSPSQASRASKAAMICAEDARSTITHHANRVNATSAADAESYLQLKQRELEDAETDIGEAVAALLSGPMAHAHADSVVLRSILSQGFVLLDDKHLEDTAADLRTRLVEARLKLRALEAELEKSSKAQGKAKALFDAGERVEVWAATVEAEYRLVEAALAADEEVGGDRGE